jgi:ATP-dependent DNA helicase PIF1
MHGADAIDAALRHVETLLHAHGCRLQDFPGMRVPAAPQTLTPRLITEQLQYDRATLVGAVHDAQTSLTPDQAHVYNAVMTAVTVAAAPDAPPSSRAFFIHSGAGCGKTYILNLLLASVRSRGGIALAMAASGVAALLLEGGTTAHFRLRIPLHPTPTSTCAINVQTALAHLLQQTSLLVIDEATMLHKHAIEAIDRTLRDVMRAIRPALGAAPFGGKPFVLAGDFRQVLPIVRHATETQAVAASVRRSTQVWPHIQVLALTTNMRVHRLLQRGADATAQRNFAAWLAAIGDGSSGPVVCIPPDMLLSGDPTIENLIYAVFGDLHSDATARTAARLLGRCILTPLNADTADVNARATAALPGAARLYSSADAVGDDDDPTAYPTEWLNTLEPQGLPPHVLMLKVGMPVIALRNLNPALGVANGTRLIITALLQHVLQAQIITGPHRGQLVLLPRITLASEERELPFTLRRRQFPIKPAFALTINKSEGQTLERVGIYLPRPVFAHGQLYVAVSRVGERSAIVFLITHAPPPGVTAPGVHTYNVVHQAALP